MSLKLIVSHDRASTNRNYIVSNPSQFSGHLMRHEINDLAAEFNDIMCIADTNVNTTMTEVPQVVCVVSSRTHTDTERPSLRTRAYIPGMPMTWSPIPRPVSQSRSTALIADKDLDLAPCYSAAVPVVLIQQVWPHFKDMDSAQRGWRSALNIRDVERDDEKRNETGNPSFSLSTRLRRPALCLVMIDAKTGRYQTKLSHPTGYYPSQTPKRSMRRGHTAIRFLYLRLYTPYRCECAHMRVHTHINVCDEHIYCPYLADPSMCHYLFESAINRASNLTV